MVLYFSRSENKTFIEIGSFKEEYLFWGMSLQKTAEGVTEITLSSAGKEIQNIPLATYAEKKDAEKDLARIRKQLGIQSRDPKEEKDPFEDLANVFE